MEEQIDVAAIRAEMGLSQAGLAKKMEIDQSSVSLWESGKTTPRGPARLILLHLLDEHRQRAGQDAA